MDHLSSSLSGMTIGIDLGDRFSHYCVLDTSGEVVERGKIGTSRDAFEEAFRRWPSSRVVMEVGAHSPWASHSAEQGGHEVLVANARRVAAIYASNTKTDRRDAELLARLGRVDPKLLSPLRHRSPQARADLALIRVRSLLVRQRTMLANCLRGTVKSAGGRIPSSIGPNALPRRAREYIPKELGEALEPVLKQLTFVITQIRELERKIERLARERYPETEVLRQVDGVGVLTSLAFVLTLEDPDRFGRSREVGPFLGLVPRRDASGRHDPELPITKAGDRQLRWLLVQCAQYTLGPFGKDSDLKRWGLDLVRHGQKNARKRAVVAMARKLAVLLLSLWKSREVYEPLRNRMTAERNVA